MTENSNPAISKTDACNLDRFDHHIFNENLDNNFLYHYTTIQSLVAITRNHSLRASPFKNVNDPAESHISNRHSLGGKWRDEENKDLNKKLRLAANLGKTVVDEVRCNAHVLCFSEDSFEDCGLIRKGFAIPQMWAHYGNRQKGVCIIFDKGKLLEEIKSIGINYHHKSIAYDTSQASGSNIMVYPEIIMKMKEDEFRKECIKASPRLFWFYKDDGWMYEQEYRVVFPEPNNEFTFIPLKNSVSGICLGSHFQNQALIHVNNFKEAFGIKNEKTPRIRWDKGVGYPTGIRYKT